MQGHAELGVTPKVNVCISLQDISVGVLNMYTTD